MSTPNATRRVANTVPTNRSADAAAKSQPQSWASPDMKQLKKKLSDSKIGFKRQNSAGAKQASTWNTAAPASQLSRSGSQGAIGQRAQGTHNPVQSAADELKADLVGKYANPFAEDTSDSDEADIDARRQQQGNTSMRSESSRTDANAQHIQAALQGMDRARQAEPKGQLESLREGVKKLKKDLATVAKVVAEDARLHTSEETRALRQKVPEALAGLSDHEVRRVFEDLYKGTDHTAERVRGLLRGNAPTRSSIEDPLTYLSGYAFARDHALKRHQEWELCSKLLNKIGTLPGGEAIVAKIDSRQLSKLSLEQVASMANALPKGVLKEQMLNFLEGVKQARKE